MTYGETINEAIDATELIFSEMEKLKRVAMPSEKTTLAEVQSGLFQALRSLTWLKKHLTMDRSAISATAPPKPVSIYQPAEVPGKCTVQSLV